jgi:acetylornithine/N-succinyldiaminopimelate aminotransferase
VTGQPTATAPARSFAERWEAVMMRNYRTPPLLLAAGSGCEVVDDTGRRYLDLLAGIAVSSLGHAHPAVVAAVRDQVGRLAHTSNLYANEPALALAERLAGLSGAPGARVFLCNDGTTANEAAVKIALRCAEPGRRRFVAAEHGFHGRSLGSLALTGKPGIREPFGPFGLEVTFVPYGDSAALRAALSDDVAAVVLEPTLGEGGVVPPPPGYLPAARAAADAAGALLVVDEVQSGIGRTGHWFAVQAEDVHPDVLTLAKGLGGGLPIGACLATGRAADAFQPGDHGSTFGGNPVAAAAALAVLDTIAADGLLGQVREVGAWWAAELSAAGGEGLRGVRGRGLWLALAVADGTAGPFERAARDAGFLVNAVRPDAVRLAPPLIIGRGQLARFTEALPALLTRVRDVAASGVPAG